MNHREPLETQRMEELLAEAVRRIYAEPDLRGFLVWAQQHIAPTLEPSNQPDERAPDLPWGVGFDALDRRRISTLLGIAIWNATPRPENGYRPIPAELPGLGEPCPCGSGENFVNCCAPGDEMPELPVELIWDAMIGDMDESRLRDALRLDAIPKVLWARVAERWLDQGKPKRAVALLEPLFQPGSEATEDAVFLAMEPAMSAKSIADGVFRASAPEDGEPVPPLSMMGAEFEPALDLLCDAYDILDFWRKKQNLLVSITDHGSRAMKTAAWQRLSTIFIEEGDFSYAQHAFEEAQRQGPEDPGTAMLEIALLTAQHKYDHARFRAEFWRHKLLRAGFGQEDEVIAFLQGAVENPQDALITAQAASMDPLLLRVRAWSDANADSASAALGIRILTDPLLDENSPQLSLFSPDDLPLPKGQARSGRFAVLLAKGHLQGLEHQWLDLFLPRKPAGTGLMTANPQDEPELPRVWLRDDWLALLEANPRAADSIEILDDLATAIYEHPESSLPWVRELLLRPLLERAEGIIRNSMDAAGVEHLPWSEPRNRPPLRLLFRLYLHCTETGERAKATDIAECLLRLNPRDNYGVRAELMNRYLRGKEDEKALALAHRFPTDRLADVAYGEVLALYRLGDRERAVDALQDAALRLPRIPRFLLRKRVKRPVLDAAGYAQGGDHQAWLYREAMRDVWEAEPGLLAWMKNLTA